MSSFQRCASIVFCLTVIGVVVAQQQSGQQGKSLGDIARELRAKKQQAGTQSADKTSAPASPAAQSASAVVAVPPEIAEFTNAVDFQVYRKDFTRLDQIADEARSTKARFPGGGWKLYAVYAQVGTLHSGQSATDADWQQHLAFLQQWVVARPKSITARVALADAYLNYAWVARGGGFADQVTPEGWRLFHERVDKAAEILADASKLEAKCPQWYVELQFVGRAQGLDTARLQQIVDKAAAEYPDYYYVYQEHAISLLPKWGGEPGETEVFATQTYRRLGGQAGAIAYFQIAAHLCHECSEFNPQLFSWEKLQEGFAALEQRYGLTPHWLNEYARMAVEYEDKQVAAKAFARIGNNWDDSVWESRANFDSHRAWAGLAPVTLPVTDRPAYVLDTRATEQLNRLLTEATQASTEGRWSDAAKLLRQVIDGAKPYPGTDYWLMKAYSALAVTERSQGRPANAKAILDEEVEFLTERIGPDSPDLANALSGRAMLAQQMNDDKSAEADLRRAMAIHKKAKSPSVALPMTAYALATLYRRHGRYQEAVTLLKPLIPSEISADPRKEASSAWTIEALAMTYQDMGKLAEAEAAYLRFMRIADVTLPVNSIGFVEPLAKMASLYHTMGKEDDAQRVEKRLDAIRQAPGVPK